MTLTKSKEAPPTEVTPVKAVAMYDEALGETRTQTTASVAGEKNKKYASLLEMSFAIVKCMVGPAALYMPNGFADAGLGTSIVIVLCANFLFAFGVLRLLDCWQSRAGRPEAADAATLATVMGGKFCGYLVQFCVCSLQLGVCVTYFIFVHETLADVLRRGGVSPPSMVVVVLCMIILEAPPATVRNLHKLAAANAMGTLLVAASLAVVAAFACVEIHRGGDSDWRWVEANPSKVFLFAGTAVFAFEGGAAVVLPAANSVAPKDRDSVKKATTVCVLVVMASYILFSTLVYVGYGRSVPVIASRALRDNSKAADLFVNGVYVLVALLSFPLQLLPATQILFPDDVEEEESWSSLSTRKAKKKKQQNGVSLLEDGALYDDDLDLTSSEGGPGTSRSSRVVDDCDVVLTSVISPLCEEDPPPRDPDAAEDYYLDLDRRRLKLKGDAKRVALVAVLGVVALLGRHSLDHVVSLLGSVSCGPLALIVGPYMHLSIAATPAGRLFDKAIIVAGLGVTVLTFASTIASWHNASS